MAFHKGAAEGWMAYDCAHSGGKGAPLQWFSRVDERGGLGGEERKDAISVHNNQMGTLATSWAF